MEKDKIKKEVEIPENIAQAILAAACDNKIACQKARDLADELGVSYAYLGQAIDQLKVRIKSCSLGCF